MGNRPRLPRESEPRADGLRGRAGAQDRRASAVEDFKREFPGLADELDELVRQIEALRNDRFLILNDDDRGISIIGPGALQRVKLITKQAADLRKALVVLESLGSDTTAAEAFLPPPDAPGLPKGYQRQLAEWVELQPTQTELDQASTALEAISRKLARQVEHLGKAWRRSPSGGRPGNPALLLETVMTFHLGKTPKQKLWTKRLAKEILGHELTSEQQYRREAARRARKNKRPQQRQT